MIYQLRLNLAIGRFKQPGESEKQMKETIESFTSLEKQLSYYNKEVRSLATYEKQGAQIYYDWGNPDQKLKVFCNCKKCKSKADFDTTQEKIYQQVRTKEIERLKSSITSIGNYTDKLSFLFNTKGFIPDRTPAVWDDFNTEPLIDLRPETNEERQVYNQFVIDAFEKEYGNSKNFTLAYNGFEFKKEKQRLNERLLNPATDKPVLLQYIKTEIEKHFNYPENLQTDSRAKHISSRILQKIDWQLEQTGHMHNLFARLCFGEKIDLLSLTFLNSHSLLNYTHTHEIFRFYQYVKQLIKKQEYLTKLDIYDTKEENGESNLEKDKLLTFETLKHKEQMITESVMNLFGFIDFLHSQTDYFLSKQNLVDKVVELLNKRNSLKPNQNFRDRIEYNKVQAEFEKEFDVLEKETTNIIKGKIQEFNIANISTPIINLNAHGDLFELQRNFSENNLKEIFEAKRKYVEFRTKTNFHYFLQSFFFDLDRDLKEFFDYFKDTPENEFEAFETKTIQVDSIEEMVELFLKSQKKTNDFEPLKKYIRDNYLNVHPNKFTLERLEQIKRNINTWKLQLKDLNEAPELQEFICETIADIDLKIARFGTNKKETEGEFSYIEKRIKEFEQVLEQYHFFSLPQVKRLSKLGQEQLLYLIATNQLPYCIAMFQFLGFLEQLENEHFKTKTDLQVEISKWFNADKQGRTVAANIRVLSPVSNEDRSRYTAHRHKETVKNDYENLK